MAHSTFTQQFELALRARYPILYIPTVEEERLEQTLRASAAHLDDRPVWTWDFVEGYQGNLNYAGEGRRNPLQALEVLEKLPESTPGIFILRDFHRFLEDISVARKLRNLARKLPRQPKTLVLVSPQLALPGDLTEIVTILEFPLPTAAEIAQEIQQLLTRSGQTLTPAEQEAWVQAGQGLSLDRLRRVLARCLVASGQLRSPGGKVQSEAVDLILEEKRQTIRQTQILDFCVTQANLADIGGLDYLKEWLIRRGGAFSQQARQYGLPYPKGLLLVGIQGTGKSLTAKAIAHHWHLPLLRLDVGRLFAGLVGESESRTRQMIQVAEALAPCILWIDEIDKAFAGLEGRGDAGTANRVFGTFLTWQSEKTSPVFVVATANQVQTLPAELLRKGRFDEIFFVDLPTQEERYAIFEVHLSHLRPHQLKAYDLSRLAYETPDFSGAEIEQTIIEAMHLGFSQNRDFTTEDILEAASQVIPLARTVQEQVAQLQAWVKAGRIRSASRHSTWSYPLK